MTLTELKELEAKATKGPWAQAEDEGPWSCLVVQGALGEGQRDVIANTITASDAAIIAAARNSLPALLRIAEAARALDKGIGNHGEDYWFFVEARALRAALSEIEP